MEFFSPAEENKRSAMALQFGLFSPLRFGPSSYSPMSRVKSLKSGSAERTKGLQTYGVALQFLDTGNRRPIWILMNKPYEAVHLAMISGV